MDSVHAKVLVADDEPHLLRLVKFRLEREGYEVLTAVDGESALQVARDEHPDLCVLDVMMPKRSGFDVLRELRSDETCAGYGLSSSSASTASKYCFCNST